MNLYKARCHDTPQGPLAVALACTLILGFGSGCGSENTGNPGAGDTNIADTDVADTGVADTSATDTSATDTSSGDASTSTCSGLSQTDCAATKGCTVVLAQDACGTGAPAIYAGCLEPGRSCGGALTCGNKGAQYGIFPSTCLPSGWALVGFDTANCCPSTPKPEWFTCDKDTDCAVFEAECCDHCNGGKLLAANKAHLGAAKAALAKPPSSCVDTMCTAMGCAPGVGVCEAGKCAAKLDPGWGKPCDSLGEAACVLSKQCVPMFAYDKAQVCDNAPTLTKTFEGCMGGGVGCGDALTCASKAEKRVVFPSTCLPAGWKAEPYETCCKPKPLVCDAGAAADLSKFCVRLASGGTNLEPGMAMEIVVYPKGCMSSSCTKVHHSSCDVTVAAANVSVTGLICVEGIGGGGSCTADCNGGGFATCKLSSLAAGDYVVSLAVSARKPA